MKSLTELSESELLDLIKDEPNKIKIYTWPNDVMEFISVYNFKSGEELIPTKLLYRLYRLWSTNPVTRKIMSNTFTDLFPSKNNNNCMCILLNKAAINIKEDAYKYVKKTDKTKKKGYLEHFEKYLNEYCIKTGSFFIKDTVLYSISANWCYKKRNPLGFTQFTNHCKLYLNIPKYKIIKDHCWFSVDHSIQKHLTEEMIKEMSSVPKKTIKKI
jgi:hypothetical protein